MRRQMRSTSLVSERDGPAAPAADVLAESLSGVRNCSRVLRVFSFWSMSTFIFSAADWGPGFFPTLPCCSAPSAAAAPFEDVTLLPWLNE
eukprot:2544380-Rhodomonas_salina.1